MIHIRPHRFAVVDVETTGDIDGYHEIVQICVLPATYQLEIDDSITPFLVRVQPDFPERIPHDLPLVNRKLAHECEISGYSKMVTANMFDEWFEQWYTPYEQRLIPIGMNFSFDRGFIRYWLGPEHYNLYFDSRVRDVSTVVQFFNDRFYKASCEGTPFSKTKLKDIANKLKIPIEHDALHDAFYDCQLTLEVYKKLLTCHPQEMGAPNNG